MVGGHHKNLIFFLDYGCQVVGRQQKNLSQGDITVQSNYRFKSAYTYETTVLTNCNREDFKHVNKIEYCGRLKVKVSVLGDYLVYKAEMYLVTR